MLSRRNALTPQQQRQKKDELKRFDGIAKPDQVYVLIDHLDRIFYVGIALRPLGRFAQHKRVAERGSNSLPEYEHWRFVGIANVRMDVVDPIGEFTEAEWKEALTEKGHVLLNVAGCVDVKRRLKGRYEHAAVLDGTAGPLVHCEAFKKLMGC